MTKVIGLTGGIGSGKSTVAAMFSELGIPVYIADDAARQVMSEAKTISKIATTFENVVTANVIDRSKLAEIVFKDPSALQQLNEIVHPAVALHFKEWLLRQTFPVVIREAAILFESGSYLDCDAIITVVAPIEDRIARVIARDNITREKVLQRINNQWSDDQRIAKSDFVIENIDLEKTKQQVSQLFEKLIIL